MQEGRCSSCVHNETCSSDLPKFLVVFASFMFIGDNAGWRMEGKEREGEEQRVVGEGD